MDLLAARGVPWALATLIAFVASGTACRYGYDPASPPLDDASMPDGQVGPPDGGPTDAAVPDAACDPTALLADSFSGAAPDPRWHVFEDVGTSTAIVNGRLRVTLPFPGLTKAYAGLVSKGGYDLSGKRLSVQVPTMVDVNGHAQALVQLLAGQGPTTYTAGFEQQNGMLHAFVHGAGAPSDRTIAYDPVAQRYWQVRESAGTLFFETSPDGLTWATALQSNAVFDVTQVHIELSAGIFQQELVTGIAEFDDLGGTVELGTACKPR